MKPIRRQNTSKALSLACGAALGTASLFAYTALPAAADTGSGASPTSATPAAAEELAPLVAKMEGLNVTSSRVSGEVTLSGHLPRKLLSLKEQTATITAEENTFPAAATVTETALGKTVTVRLVNGKLYLNDPALAAHDGGRPWVQVDSHEVSALQRVDNGSALGGSLGTYKSVATLLKGVTAVSSLGASTVNGQSVTGFAGTIAPTKIEEPNLPAGLRTRIRKLNLKLSGTVEAFIAADGLPVRTVYALGIGDVHMKITENVLAVDEAIVAVTPPAASETITASKVRALVAKKKKKVASKAS
jgi:hypothetical protein